MSKVFKSVVIIMIAMIFSKILGFSRDLFLAYFYGTSSFTDAYVFSFMLPSVLFGSLGMALLTTIIPIYKKNLKEKGIVKSNLFLNNVLNIAVIISILISIISYLYPEIIVNMMSGEIDHRIYQTTVEFCKIILLAVPFIMIQYVFMAYLQLNDNFKIPALVGIPFNIVLIASIVLGSIYKSKEILIYGSLFSFVAIVIFLYVNVKSYGYKINFKLDFKDKDTKKVFKNLVFVFIGLSVLQITTISDRALAFGLSNGSVSALNYSNRLNEFIFGIFALSIITVMYPKMSELCVKKDYKALEHIIRKSINIISILIVPIVFFIIFFSNNIISFLFERGSFDINATIITANAFRFYAFSILGFSFIDLFSKVFYSMDERKTPLFVGIFAICINLIFNYLLKDKFEISGIAISTSIASILGALILFMLIKLKTKIKGGKKLVINLVKIFIASFLMSYIAYFISLQLESIIFIGNNLINKALNLCISGIIGVFIYIGLIVILKVDEIKEVLELILSKLKINK
ncbi:MAG: murein biosynthesis integral membrane protein MurJ [Peptostreptococcaceae bacterium]|jgi:putative peptidoglycan lipid II flippase|nr:murein biosynthesis integral membrane protein MurJ [Peptostreptococcaceae bacterium]